MSVDLLIPFIVVLNHLDDARVAGRIEANILSIRSQHSERGCGRCHRAVRVYGAGGLGPGSTFVRFRLFGFGMRGAATGIQESPAPCSRGCSGSGGSGGGLSSRLLRQEKSRQERDHGHNRELVHLHLLLPPLIQI